MCLYYAQFILLEMYNFSIYLNWNWQQVNRWLLRQITSTFLPCNPINKSVRSIYLQSYSFNEVCLLKFKYSLNLYIIITLMHGLRTPREEKAFPARPRIQSQSQIFRYDQSIFCLPHRPNFSDIIDLCLHWFVRSPCMTYLEFWIDDDS